MRNDREPYKIRLFLTSLLRTILNKPVGFDEAVRTTMRRIKLDKREKRSAYIHAYQTIVNYYGLKYLAEKKGLGEGVKAIVNLLEKLNYNFETYLELMDEITQEMPIEERLAKKYSYPLWVVKELLKHLPVSEVEKTLRNLNEKKRWARVNTVNATLEEALECLENEGVRFQRHPKFEDFLRITDPFYPIGGSKCFRKGLLIPEDLSSYVLVESVMKYVASPLLDSCSAPGVKLFHILSKNATLRAIAVDYSSKRLLYAVEILKTYVNQGRILLINGDSRILAYKNRFSTIVLDAPCSGSGAVYGDPSVKLRLSREHVRRYALIQYELMKNVIKQGENIVYTTCSILPIEGEMIVQRIYKEARAVLQDLVGDYIDPAYPGYDVSYKTFRIYPHKVEGQGFFISVLRGVR
ncbi:RsmB/NOP family class I SAM-dependent RNA methyltransferase [Thermosphaera chiliense]|uniref:RsmB/NOP family class I SAM-dependent RNA methyltransferase n=1 Tax=Thermosphaera chiliense TaxID=3402707 RepID=A0A7M1UPK7_9CREN|nr:RsmB/NOP family class I SAM-dependent RNA methyltransferase [Thermosphaera aggregans]QOR94195.1 RsmB/NOP family class I SAM-dependent RNA methyltransferase [Thermosphaera aggregans]